MIQFPKNLAEWEYKTPKVVLVPYVESQGEFPEDFLAKLYFQTKRDDLLPIIFPGMSMKHMNHFVSYLSKRPLLVYCVMNGEMLDVAGFAWITEHEGPEHERKAGFGFGFFKAWQGKRETRDLVWLCLRWWFNELKISILYGTTLQTNGPAKNFSRIFGFVNQGVLPKFFYRNGRLEDASLELLEEAVFTPKFEAWLSGTKRSIGLGTRNPEPTHPGTDQPGSAAERPRDQTL